MFGDVYIPYHVTGYAVTLNHERNMCVRDHICTKAYVWHKLFGVLHHQATKPPSGIPGCLINILTSIPEWRHLKPSQDILVRPCSWEKPIMSVCSKSDEESDSSRGSALNEDVATLLTCSPVLSKLRVRPWNETRRTSNLERSEHLPLAH